MAVDAVVLIGGRARRLGGRSKAEIVVDGERLVDRYLRVLADCRRVVLVGPDPDADPEVDAVVVREDPPFAGPVAGIAAGVAALDPVLDQPVADDRVLVLAGDMPGVADVVTTLLAEPVADSVVGVDRGRVQPLAGVHRPPVLRDALRGLDVAAGPPVMALLDRLRPDRVELPPGCTDDIDTPDDLVRWS